MVHITPHKAVMVSGCEGTVNMAPNRQQMDTASSTKHRMNTIRHPRQERSKSTYTRTNSCRHSDPTALACRGERTNEHTYAAHNTDHATCPVCLVHRRKITGPANTCSASGG
jgi:hypothetical protein